MLHTASTFSWFHVLRELSKKYFLPDPLLILCNPPPKFLLKKLVRKKILDFFHKQIIEATRSKSSLKFLRSEYIPLGSGPHPMWLSFGSSSSAVQAATIVAQIISGKYKDDYLCSKWNNSSGSCSYCNFYPGDCVHYLSGKCPALSYQLQTTLDNCIQFFPTFPDILSPVLDAYGKSALEWSIFILDPIFSPSVIKLKQEYGFESVQPLMRLSRAYVWTMHRERMKLSDK